MLRNPTTPHVSLGADGLLAERYRIEREIGRGGMAVVYLAHDTRHERRVAVKFIADELGSAVGTQRFLQEIKLTAALQHPHVLSVYDSGVTADNRLYYVMPFVDGGSLRARLEASGPLPLDDAVRIAREAADALGFAHDRGIVHRDVKPENILFSAGHALVADFGIARLATSPSSQPLTVQGIVVGTPAYMSPEQGFGGEVDARSDVYSLAVVVYEMLTGKVPFASPAAGSWSQFGLSRVPPSLRADRPEIPEAVEEILIRALAPSAQDRPAGARELAAELERAAAAARSGTVPAPAITTGTRSRRAWRRGLFAGVAVGATALVAGGILSPSFRTRLVALGVVDVNPGLVLVTPVQSPSPTAPLAQMAERMVREELSRWDGVRVMTADATRDVLSADAAGLTLDDVVGAARRARAELVVWGSIASDGTLPVVETRLVNGRTGVIEATRSAAPPSSDTAWRSWARDLGADLLAGAPIPAAAHGGIGATRSLVAWRAFVRGHALLADWKLPAADSAFARAVAADPRFAPAKVWYAQTMVWNRRGSRADWRRHADEALMHAGTLSEPDGAFARAMAALGRRDDPAACEAYATLVARDSMDARAWMGLGDCRAMDSIVVRDPRSPSGRSFRGNRTAALEAYERAVRLSPAAYAALSSEFIGYLILTQPDRYRHGIAAEDSSTMFGARPSPSGDSVVYVPYRIVRNTLPADPPGFEEALYRNRARLLEYVTAWTQRVPGSVDAFELLAAVQEGRGELMGIAARGRLSALAALDSAQRLTVDGEAGARVGASRVRVLVKAGEFERARALADSLLSRASAASARESFWLAGLAALTGRARLAATLARVGNAPPVQDWDTLPAPVGQAATLQLVQSAAGVCTDEFRESFPELERLIDSYTAPARRAATRTTLMSRSRRLAMPCLGAEQVTALQPRSYWDRMQDRLARGDPRGVRAAFDSLALVRRHRRPGGTAADFTFMEGWLLTAIGDTSAAIAQLDLTLQALPTLSRNAAWELAQSAALARAMAWRAELARSRGDRQNTERWSAAVLALWKNADPELRPVLDRMRAIAR